MDTRPSADGTEFSDSRQGSCGVGRSPDASVTDPPRCVSCKATQLSAKRGKSTSPPRKYEACGCRGRDPNARREACGCRGRDLNVTWEACGCRGRDSNARVVEVGSTCGARAPGGDFGDAAPGCDVSSLCGAAPCPTVSPFLIGLRPSSKVKRPVNRGAHLMILKRAQMHTSWR